MNRGNTLVLRGGALGDFILAMPVLSALRTDAPGSRVCVAGYMPQARLAVEGGLADEAVSLDEASFARLFAVDAGFSTRERAWFAGFDTAISFLRDPDGVVVRNLKGLGVRRVLSRDPLPPTGTHAADHLAAVLRELGGAPPRPAIPAFKLRSRDGASEGVGRPVVPETAVVLHPGSGSARKNWPIESFVAVAGVLHRAGAGSPVFLFGEADGAALGRYRAMSAPWPVLAGLDVLEVSRLLSECCAYVGNDSGVTHLAAALGCNCVAVFGPTNPSEWGPRGDNVRLIRAGSWSEGGPGALGVDVVAAKVVSLLDQRVGKK
ncbi:MAG: glycosyltransferase family 9 protein [Lentisphaerae bacterium]|nr:glycosyltransferase family 9 protein [Lentisphaerota bacterium]